LRTCKKRTAAEGRNRAAAVTRAPLREGEAVAAFSRERVASLLPFMDVARPERQPHPLLGEVTQLESVLTPERAIIAVKGMVRVIRVDPNRKFSAAYYALSFRLTHQEAGSEKPPSLASGRRLLDPWETSFSELPSAHRIAALAAIPGTLAVSAARLPSLQYFGVVPDAVNRKPPRSRKTKGGLFHKWGRP
jgi:hypothetical protein